MHRFRSLTSTLAVSAAVDTKTRRDVWQIQAPMTYGGKQYVTVANGHNILTFGLP